MTKLEELEKAWDEAWATVMKIDEAYHEAWAAYHEACADYEEELEKQNDNT